MSSLHNGSIPVAVSTSLSTESSNVLTILCSAVVPTYVVEYSNGVYITGDLTTLAKGLSTTVANLNQVVSTHSPM